MVSNFIIPTFCSLVFSRYLSKIYNFAAVGFCGFFFCSGAMAHILLQTLDRVECPDDKKDCQPRLDIHNDAGFKNGTGLCLRVLQDSQKLVGCQVVCDEEKGPDNMMPVEKKGIKIRAAQSDKYSGRVNLLFRTNLALKTGLGWGTGGSC